MRKLFKSLFVVACVGAIGAGVACTAACGSKGTTAEAYALVHTADSVGYASVTVNGKKITKVTLTEVCLPAQVKTADEDKYAKVTYDNVVLTWDAEAERYKTADGLDFQTYLATTATCKAYYDAVVGNRITAYEKATDTSGKKDVMTKKTLCKDDNGYWGTASSTQKHNWKENRDATVKFVKSNGIDALMSLTYNEETKEWESKGVAMGATWTDLNPASASGVKKGYVTLTYAQLIKAANDAAVALAAAK